MLLIYELEPFDPNAPGAKPNPYSEWDENYTGGKFGDAPGVFPDSNWDLDLLRPYSQSDQTGGTLISTYPGGAFYIQTSDTGSPDGTGAGDGNLDAGETFTILINTGTADAPVYEEFTATVDYFFTPNANPDTSLMVFIVDNGDGTSSKYALNMGNGVDGELDPQRIQGGLITEGMTNQGSTFYDGGSIVCFVAGTHILTASGEVAIEDLKVGDSVKTIEHGNQEIRWIGSVSVKSRGKFAPVKISAGALGENSPSRDLFVSPAHRMVISGWRAELLFDAPEVLVPASALVNDSTITYSRENATVEYFHIMFDNHEIVISNGAPSESFNPTHDAIGNLTDESRKELLSLFPELNQEKAAPAATLPSLSSAEASVLMKLN